MAARSRDLGTQSARKRLQLARERGGLAKGTSDDISGYSSKVGYHLQATSLLNGNPSRDALNYMGQRVDAAQHPQRVLRIQRSTVT